MNDRRQPVTTLADLAALDSAEKVEGYNDGFNSELDDREPGGNRSRSYWHGWRNGRVDAGHADPDPAQRQLARAFIDAKGVMPCPTI